VRKGQAALAVLFLCAFLAALAVWAALLVAGQALRGGAWMGREAGWRLAASSALEWSRWRLSSDARFLCLASPQAEEALPAEASREEVRARYFLESRAGRSTVYGPDVSVPPGLLAALYVLVEDDFSAGGTADWAPVTAAGLDPSWSVVPSGTTPGSGQVEPPGLFRGGSEGTVDVSVPSFSGPPGGVPVGNAAALAVSVGAAGPAPPAVRLSPRVQVVETEREVPFTALAWGASGVAQAVPPGAVFQVAGGPGSLVAESWGVRYVPAGPGAVCVAVTAVVDGVQVSDSVYFQVVAPQRLCRVVPVVGGREAGAAWVRDRGGSAEVLTWSPAR